MAPEYVPLMLRPGWVLERHFGWTVEFSEGSSLKLLRKRAGPFRRRLLLVREASADHVQRLARDHKLFAGGQAVVVDLDGRPLDHWRRVGGPRLEEAGERRWFGVGTFVVDLARDVPGLWEQMASRARNMCRRAEKSGLAVEFSQDPAPAQLDRFFSLYAPMAARHDLQVPSRRAIERMFAAGELLLATCSSSRAEPLAMNLIYLGGDAALYLYGVRGTEAAPPGAGHCMQWQGIQRLKSMGLRWYDLGQVPSTSNRDGIFLFKSSFGGRFLGFGTEYHWSSPLATLAGRARALAARALRPRPREARSES